MYLLSYAYVFIQREIIKMFFFSTEENKNMLKINNLDRKKKEDKHP